MKTNTTQFIRQAILLLGAFFMITFISCKEEEPAPDPIASFQYAISETNFLEVTFTNYSQNAVSYSWDFGDTQTSTLENPVHAYATVGSYVVVLTATNKDGATHTFSETITITDPLAAIRILTGDEGKTWKLYRVDRSMGIGPDLAGAGIWWGLTNDGSRPCLYKQTFTFYPDGSFVFDDNGMIWGEGDIFADTEFFETCFPAEAANMVKADGTDVSAWLGGTHAFEFNPSAGKITVTGTGAYLGIVKCGTSGYVGVPQESVTYDISIEEFEGYDLMTISVTYPADGHYWDFKYASYSNTTLEPEVVEEAEEWGENLEDVTPTSLFHTFETETSFELLGAIGGTSVITVGVDDPANAAATKVGKFERIASQYQEAQLRISPDPKDIQFDNFTTAKIDIYIPAETVFAEGGLLRHIVFGFGDLSQTQEWWNSPVQFVKEGDAVIVGEWTTYEFDLTDVKARQDLDMIFLGIGGGGHTAVGTFYVRNLTFE